MLLAQRLALGAGSSTDAVSKDKSKSKGKGGETHSPVSAQFDDECCQEKDAAAATSGQPAGGHQSMSDGVESGRINALEKFKEAVDLWMQELPEDMEVESLSMASLEWKPFRPGGHSRGGPHGGFQ